MAKATIFAQLNIRVEIEVEADTEEQAKEEFHMMPDYEIREAIAKSDYFDLDTFTFLNVEVN